ncbi:undecaprenyl-phosphate alpha-N-acetylglucosaminyl 1-phosphate transferase [Serinibacter arcticus]|uniref:Undecaprenyl-phosphate alpha-N-acetylglucosaminyl 1-phosphate transferase n=1 Tax=Serinibacter arcticus TaxID=1655435 RepID=A0A2U1ZYW5_9MICO|nr:MraY family glycosyltransferase [Serinibacter arcticus]PWD52171.1 undecaprenyl-phosphate alpha-N-acetylglucosaminyl 1-phosphate transferase [Serinibacter arcticus]
MRIYLLVIALAAAVTFVATPLVRVLARRVNAVTPLRERDVHEVPTPRMGGVAMLVGFAVALLVASRTEFLGEVFTVSPQAWAILGSAVLICLLGAADDIWDLDWITKLVGQVLCAGLMVWQGVQLVTLPLFDSIAILSPNMLLAITLLIVLVAINAVNFVDGLDGLAAGLIAIGGGAFFVYSYLLTVSTDEASYANLATLIIAAVVGACLGFLPHNFFKASIFMGDSGAMFLGLTLSAAGIIVTGNIDPGASAQLTEFVALPAFLPILLPVAVMLIPLVDLVFAVVRRIAAGKSPFAADGRHLHHRLMARGHSHRRTVVILYAWTTVFAFGAVALAFLPLQTVLIALTVAVVVGIVLTVVPLPVRRSSHRSRHVKGPEAREKVEP